MSDAATLVETLRERGIRDERVLAAIAAVDRSAFVPPDLAGRAWEDSALPIGSGQTISQPYIVALMTAALDLRGGETVLEIGTGSGYQAAILCRLCRRLVTVERLPELAESARDVLDRLGCRGVEYRVGDGTLGAPADGPFDGIIVTAAAPDVPRPLYDQLAEGGRLVIPVGPRDDQELVAVERVAGGPRVQTLCKCRFVPLIGACGWQD